MLNAFVVFVGFLILSGRGEHVDRRLERRVEPRGGRRRAARLVFETAPPVRHELPSAVHDTGLQLVTILASRGDIILLGEAYAFGVVWSFVFNTLSMVVLRFKKRGPREFRRAAQYSISQRVLPDRFGTRVPHDVSLGDRESVHQTGGHDQRTVFRRRVPTCLRSPNTCTASAAARSITSTSSSSTAKRCNQVTKAELGLKRPYCKLVAIRSPHNLFMLDKALADTDPQTTDVVVMTAKVEPQGADMPTEHADGYLRPATADSGRQSCREAGQNGDAAAGADEQCAACRAEYGQGIAVPGNSGRAPRTSTRPRNSSIRLRFTGSTCTAACRRG